MSFCSESATSSTYSSQVEEEDEEEEWDEEDVDEEIMELREVLERSRLTVSHFEDSGDSLDNEADNELIKAKLRALRDYVKDLQASYDELLQTFKQLEDAAKQKVLSVEGKLATALKCAKDFQDRCNILEGQLKLLREKSLERSTSPDAPEISKDAQQQIHALEEDLSSVLKAITEGVESGVIKLSKIDLATQENPLPLQDVIVGVAQSEGVAQTEWVPSVSQYSKDDERTPSRSPCDHMSRESKGVWPDQKSVPERALDKASKRVGGATVVDTPFNKMTQPHTDTREQWHEYQTENHSTLQPHGTQTVVYPHSQTDAQSHGTRSNVSETQTSSSVPQPQTAKLQTHTSSSIPQSHTTSDETHTKAFDVLPQTQTTEQQTHTSSNVPPSNDETRTSTSVVPPQTQTSEQQTRTGSRVPQSYTTNDETRTFVPPQTQTTEQQTHTGSSVSQTRGGPPVGTQEGSSDIVSAGSHIASGRPPTKTSVPIVTDNLHASVVNHAHLSSEPTQVERLSKETQTSAWTGSHDECSFHTPVSNPTHHVSTHATMLMTPPPSNSFAPSYATQEHYEQEERPILKHEYQSESSSALEDEMIESPMKDIQFMDDDLLAQISEKDCRIAELETSVLDLQHQLQEFEHLHESTQLSLKDTQSQLKNQRINGVINNEEELSDVMSKITSYETQRDQLQSLVEEEQQRVLELERQRKEAMIELNELQQKISTLSLLAPTIPSSSVEGLNDESEEIKLQLKENETSLAAVKRDTDGLEAQRDILQRQCTDVEEKVDQLQASLKGAKHDANRLQAITARKESELMKIISAIHATRAKLASIHKVDRNGSVDETSDDNIKGLEWDVNTIKEKWEELCEDLSKHEAAIASLTGRELTLQGELDRRAARVIELEALVQAREVGMGFNKKSVSVLQTSLGLLKNELTDTKNQHKMANEQMEEVYQRLQSTVHLLVDKLELLNNQVSSKDKKLKELQMEQQQIWKLYQLNNEKVKEEESLKLAKEQALLDLKNELLASEQRIDDLEEEITANNELREKDLEYQWAVISDVIGQLQQVNNSTEQEVDHQERSGTSGVAMSLQAKVNQRDRLLQALNEQTSLLLEQHSHLVHQVDERQDVVNDLESKLLSAQTLCDALEQEVADGHKKLAQVQTRLIESEREKMELQMQLEMLQNEAEDACTGLENAIRKNTLLKQESEDAIEAMKRQLHTQRLLKEQSDQTTAQLSEVVEEKEDEITNLHRTIEGLQLENVRLETDNTQHQTLIAKLMEEMDLSGSDTQALHSELADRLLAVESLRSQLDEAESARIVAETIAEERLNDVMSLQQHNQELLTTNSQIQLQLSDVDNAKTHQEQIDLLKQEIETVKALYEDKSIELDKVKYSYHLSTQKEGEILQQLEECRRELAVCKRRAEELDIRYQSTLQDLSTSQSEVDSLRLLQTSSQVTGSTADLKVKIRKLEKDLKDSKLDVDRLQQKYQVAVEDKRNLLRKLGALEEHHHSLIRTSSQQKLDLNRSKRHFEEQRKLCVSLQGEYDTLADQVSDWATTHKSTTDALIQKLREQDREISSLKAKHDRLVSDNSHLRKTLDERTVVDHSTGIGGVGGGASPHTQRRRPVSAQETRDDQRTLPLNEVPQIQNQYQQILEKGLSSTSALDTSGYSSPTESTDELDKSYWIKRAGELSLQLQQSSEYWSNKVREQSLKIQKYESKK